MRWFKHLTDTRHNPKFRAIEKKFGESGYARAIKLFEIVAERGGSGKEFRPIVDLRKPPTDLDWLADEWKISKQDATATLDFFAAVRLVDPKPWRRKIIQVPQMLEYRDEWTERQQHGKNSRVAPEPLPSHSGKSRGRVEVETEKEAEAEQNAAAAPSGLENHPLQGKAWKDVGIYPFADSKLRAEWERAYTRRDPDEKLSDTMECYIQECQSKRAIIPKPFYDAKRRIERNEKELADTEEVSRVAGPRGVRPENMR